MLPRLIRRLVLETGVDIAVIDFPADEGTAAGGFDGFLRANGATPFVPDGISVWELSVQRGYSKAETDYAKRTKGPDGVPARKVAYVQVILRPWTERQKFASSKTAEGRWREVRALGVDDVLAWLESAPVTHAWLSEQLGLSPYGMTTVDKWWDNWAAATQPRMPEELLLSGRGDEVRELRDRLRSGARTTTVLAESRDEALAFVCAAARRQEADAADSLFARAVLVDKIEAWRSLIEHKQALVLVPLTRETLAEVHGVDGHHVVVPVTSADRADIVLSSIDAERAREALAEVGLSPERASEAGKLARRNLLALRRHLAVNPELHTPAWSLQPSRLHRAVLLAGAWADLPSDLELLSDLAGVDESEFREGVDALTHGEDPLVDQLESFWALVSHEDAWQFLGKRLRLDDVKRLQDAVSKVLLEPDPLFGLQGEERIAAQFNGAKCLYSAALRRGLCSTLALLGAYGDTVTLGRGHTGADWARTIVSELLTTANASDDASVWSGFERDLSTLAEAAPDEFLVAVRAGTAGEEAVLGGMFVGSEGASPIFGHWSPHVWLLRALEVLAWSPLHFGGVIDALARLDELDSRDEASGRPGETLARIYCPWRPETSASVQERLSVLDALRERHEKTAWSLMIELMPDPHAIHSESAVPRYRDWKGSEQSVAMADYVQFVDGLVKRLLADAGKNVSRWVQVLDASEHASPEQRAAIREGLDDLSASGCLGADDAVELWEHIRGFVAKHREFSDAQWALPSAELSEFEALAVSVAPTDTLSSSAWLFAEHRPDLGTGQIRSSDFAAYDAELLRLREAAVDRLHKEAGGLELVLRLAKKSVVPNEIGAALAAVSGDAYANDILQLLKDPGGWESDLSAGWVWRRFRSAGWHFVDALHDSHSLTSEQAASVLCATREHPEAWRVAARWGSDVASAFWARCMPFGVWDQPQAVREATEGLLSANRPAAALDFLGLAIHGSEEHPTFAELVVRSFEQFLLLQADDDRVHRLERYRLEALFAYLEKHVDHVGRDVVARLEWAYLPALGFSPVVPSLHRALATDPTFFVEVMKIVYRPRSGNDDDSSHGEEHRRLVHNGYRLLSSWREVPGLRDGQVQKQELKSWIEDVLVRLKAVDRLEVGEMQIGHMLASAPADSTGAPPEVVRDLLEELASDQIEQSLETELLNRRGVVTRGLDEGGAQERALADDLAARARQFSHRWPRTAALLNRLADDYATQARRRDGERETRRRGQE